MVDGAAPLGAKTVIVAGASSGIGLATANALTDAGARVHGLARRQAKGNFSAHACDVTDAAQVHQVVGAIAADGLDAVVITAGTNVPHRALGELALEDWHLLVDVNLSGAFHVLHACLPFLRRAGGDIVLVSSVSALWPDASGAAYQASKAGLLALGRAAALEEHRHGVRVSTVLPGLVDTPLLLRRAQPPGPERLALALQPDDVAETCLFLLCLPARAYIPEVTILPTALQALGDT